MDTGKSAGDKGGVPKKKKNAAWAPRAFILTFVLAMVVSLFSKTAIENVPLPIAVFVLFLIISIGILFDVIGIAVATASVAPFTAMAAKRMKGAKQAIKLTQNTGKVSNICNDVVGDICGIVSGSAGAVICYTIISSSGTINDLVLNTIVSSLIAAMTVGGKAMFKQIAIHRSSDIVITVGRILAIFSRK